MRSRRFSDTARVTWTWLALSALTLVSFWLGSESDAGVPSASTAVTFGVLAIAFVKVRAIMRVFMEVRTAPRWLKRFCDSWLVVVWVTLFAIYLA